MAESFPDDADVLTLYGAALMNLSAWDYRDGAYGHRTMPGAVRDEFDWAWSRADVELGASRF